ESVDGGGAVREAHGDHAGAAHGVDDGFHLVGAGLFVERGEIEAYRRAFKEMRRGGDAARQLIEDGAGIGRANADLREADLAKANFEWGSSGLSADRFGWLVHSNFFCARKR